MAYWDYSWSQEAKKEGHLEYHIYKLFRYLTVKYRIKYPIKYVKMAVDHDLSHQLEDKICVNFLKYMMKWWEYINDDIIDSIYYIWNWTIFKME